MKFVILLLVCGTTVSSYFSYNSTAVISTQLIEKLDLSQFEYGLLYSIYSIPNLVLPLIGGVLIDRLGVRFGLMLFLTLIAVGSGIVAIAPYMSNSFAIMLLGRFIFGLGSEASYVAQDTLCVIWFGGKSIALAFGFISGVERAVRLSLYSRY
jgi:MFS family permease